MKIVILSFLLAAVVFVECRHQFMGTNIQRPLVHHYRVEYNPRIFRNRGLFYNYYYTMPAVPAGSTIQGILLYDLTHSGATAEVTNGGLGFHFVNLRMRSDPGMKIDFDVYIYA